MGAKAPIWLDARMVVSEVRAARSDGDSDVQPKSAELKSKTAELKPKTG